MKGNSAVRFVKLCVMSDNESLNTSDFIALKSC